MKKFWLITFILLAYLSGIETSLSDARQKEKEKRSSSFNNTGTVQSQNTTERTIIIDSGTYQIDNEVLIHNEYAADNQPHALVPQNFGPQSFSIIGKKIGFNLDKSERKPPRISEIWFIPEESSN